MNDSNSQHEEWKKNNFKYASEDLERNEIDTMKMYEAVKKIKQLAPKEKLIIKTKELNSNEIKSVRNHSKIFRKHFYLNATPTQNVLPTPMVTPFPYQELRKPSWTLKDDKSPGID